MSASLSRLMSRIEPPGPHDGAEMVPLRHGIAAAGAAHVQGVHSENLVRKGDLLVARHDGSKNPVHK